MRSAPLARKWTLDRSATIVAGERGLYAPSAGGCGSRRPARINRPQSAFVYGRLHSFALIGTDTIRSISISQIASNCLSPLEGKCLDGRDRTHLAIRGRHFRRFASFWPFLCRNKFGFRPRHALICGTCLAERDAAAGISIMATGDAMDAAAEKA